MRLSLSIALIFCAVLSHAQITTLLTVGDIPVTSYDVEQMRAFMEATGTPKPKAEDALETLMDNAALLTIAQGSADLAMNENEFRRVLNNITNATAQAGGEERQQIYQRFPEMFRMALRADKARRGLTFSDTKIRAMVNVPTSEADRKAYYNKNKNEMKDSIFPKFNLIVFAVEADDKMSLTEISRIEEDMQALADDLSRSSDGLALRKKYSRLKFTKYSGTETGLFTPDILVLQKKIPEEVIGASMQKTLPIGGRTITIAKNKGVFIPVPVPLRISQKPTYITFKLLDLVQPRMLSFEEASPRIDEILRQERGQQAVKELIRQRIREGQVTLTVVDAGKLRPVINKFISGNSKKND